MDTDVLVLGISLALIIGCERLWLAFGTGSTYRYLDVIAMAQALGEDKCMALPAFHALTGCDVTSSFAGRGKRTAWSAWSIFNDATSVLCTLAKTPTTDDVLNVLPTIERLVMIMYDYGSSETSVDVERQMLFTKKGRQIENIPRRRTSPASATSRIRGRTRMGSSNDQGTTVAKSSSFRVDLGDKQCTVED